MDIKNELNQKSYIIHAINSYLEGNSLKDFFPNKPVEKIEKIIKRDFPNISKNTIEEIEKLVF